MARQIFALFLLLTVGNLAHCQEWENLFIKMEVLLEKQEAALVKQEAALSQLKEIQEKQEHVEGKLQEMQEKLQHVEINLQGAVNSNQDSLQRQQHLESSLLLEISEVISLLETGGIDECSEGSHNCTDYEACADKLFKYQCSCLPGFARDGSHCEDVDECAQGKDDCSPLATCRNSVGSYSCSCNPPSEGDGRTCSCPPGFAQKGSNCEDIDECAQGKAECSPKATCRNSVGSYSCSCNPPFEGDGRTCDIDECAHGKAECSPKATCRNSVGSYSCSCNPPFEGDGRTCEFQCRRPAKVLEGLGCVKFVDESKTFKEMNATCHRAGGRLLQDFSIERLHEVVRAFDYGRGYIGVQEGKWLESGLPLQEELWREDSQGSDPSGRRGLCGLFVRDSYSSSFKVGQLDCSTKTWGYCQFINPQK